MRRPVLLLLFLSALAGCTAGAGQPAPTSPVANRAPHVTSFEVSPRQIGPNGTISFTLVAYDPEGDPLRFSWAASRGTVSGNGANATWRPSQKDEAIGPGPVTVAVGISDGQLSTAVSVNMNVRDDGTTEVQQVQQPAPLPAGRPLLPSPTPSPAPESGATGAAEPTASGAAG